MRLRELVGVSFRNYAHLAFAPHPRCTVLCGANGQGKTNVLEAIALLALGRSHRGARDRQLTMWGAEGYRLEGRFEAGEGDKAVRTVLVFEGSGKQVECDGVPEPRLSALLGRTPVSLFAPEDLALVKGGPVVRRRMLDMNLSQISPVYLGDLQTYTRTLKQRNKAISDWSTGQGAYDAVTLWDRQLVDAGSRLHTARAEYVDALADEAAAIHGRVSNTRESLEVRYAPSVPTASTVEQQAAAFGAALAEQRSRERGVGATPCGPHRDDLKVFLNGKPLREFGSQGQHRSAVLALKLAEGAVLHTRSPTPPITLLDDFASELDERRQVGILETVCTRGQVLITTTEVGPALDAVADKAVFRVTDGMLAEVQA